MRNLNGSQAQPRMQREQVVYDRGKVQIQDAGDQFSPERKSPWKERVVSGVKSVWREGTDWGGRCEGRVGVHRRELEKLLRRNCFRVDERQD